MTEYYSYNKIVNISKEIVNNVNKNKELGRGVFWAYFISQAILNPKTKIEKIKIDKPSQYKGNLIKRTVKQYKYIEIAKYIVWYVKKKGRMPNEVEYKNSRMFSPQVYTDLLANVLVYYDKKSKFPSEVIADASKFIKPETQKLYDYLLNSGCSGIGQCTPYYCADASLQQMFYHLTGTLVSESTIAGWAGTTTDGTDHEGIATAVAMFNKKYNKNVKIVWYNFSELGNSSSARWSKIKELLSKGGVFFHLLYRDQWGHYEAIKTVGDALEILNSLGDRCDSPAYCGYVETRSRGTQERYIGGISQKSVAFLYNG